VNDGLNDAVAIVVYETQRSALVGNSQSELVVINQAHLRFTQTQHCIEVTYLYNI